MSQSGIADLVQAIGELVAQLGQTPSPSSSTSANTGTTAHHPRLSTKLPTYRGEPSENIQMWSLQCSTIFAAQAITNDATCIHYASTTLKDGALHWYLNKVTTHQSQAGNKTMSYTTWDDFVTALRDAFQPPHYQQYLRKQLRKCCQTSTVQEYTTRFRNLVEQITDMNEVDQVMYFIDGLRPATQQEVQYQCPTTLDDA